MVTSFLVFLCLSYHSIKLLTLNCCLQDIAAQTHSPDVILIPYCVDFYTWLGFLFMHSPLRYGRKYKETILEVKERILNSAPFDGFFG